MTPIEILELAGAAILLGAGIYFYRRPASDGQKGGQGAILIVVAGLLAIHGLGLLRYHPSNAELDAAVQRS